MSYQLIVDGKNKKRQIEPLLLRLFKEYENSAFAVAWATKNTVYSEILKQKNKIHKAVIGTHFYQTDPGVLDDFIESEKIHFNKFTGGVFHPKIFVFWNTSNWEAVIGSANLTNGAFAKNDEVMLSIKGSSDNCTLLDELKTTISGYWEEALCIDKNYAGNYRNQYNRMKRHAAALSGANYKKARKTPVESNILSMSWNDYFDKVRSDTEHYYKDRYKLLQFAGNLFGNYDDYNSMKISDKLTLAGLKGSPDPNYGWFGNLDARVPRFVPQSPLIEESGHISRALASIPLVGRVKKKHFDNYIDHFSRAYPSGYEISIASRLLAMKRPDYFVSLNTLNKKGLCADFGIASNKMTYKRYWVDITARIIDSIWWNAPRPNKKKAGYVWDGRAAMMDAIFYEPE